jgi:hypothetical protein
MNPQYVAGSVPTKRDVTKHLKTASLRQIAVGRK